MPFLILLAHLLDQRENAFSNVRLFRPCRFDGFFYTTLSSYPPTLKEDIANDQNKCICPLHLSSWMVIIDIGDVFIFREQRVVISSQEERKTIITLLKGIDVINAPKPLLHSILFFNTFSLRQKVLLFCSLFIENWL